MWHGTVTLELTVVLFAQLRVPEDGVGRRDFDKDFRCLGIVAVAVGVVGFGELVEAPGGLRCEFGLRYEQRRPREDFLMASRGALMGSESVS